MEHPYQKVVFKFQLNENLYDTSLFVNIHDECNTSMGALHFQVVGLTTIL